MGGDGSGVRADAKPTTDEALRLDVRWLARQGWLRPAEVGPMAVRWTCNGTPTDGLLVFYDRRRPDEVRLRYHTRQYGETSWTAVREVIPLEWTDCHYGGERVWWRCPGCGRRKAVLYGVEGRFSCVRCHGLAYSSTREDALARAGRRGTAILEKLGAEPTWVLTWGRPPPKPKGMHATTYRRLVRAWAAVRTEAIALARAAQEPWQARFARRGKRRRGG